MPDKPTDTWFPAEGEAARDPVKTVQAGMKPALPNRFYERASTEERNGAFVLLLDGRTAKTPAQNLLAVPTLALGEAVAGEWGRQQAVIDPAAMPLTRIVNSAIDGVAPRRDAVIEDMARYAGSDLVCYRAGEPERLVRQEAEAWDPILAWAREALGARFILSQGVMHVEQPERAIEAVRIRLEAETSPFRIAALHVMTTLTGSVLIALAHADAALTLEAAWAAAHVDERFQESLWGEDESALKRRAGREVDFRAASTVYRRSGVPRS